MHDMKNVELISGNAVDNKNLYLGGRKFVFLNKFNLIF